MGDIFQTQATVDKITTLKDGSLKVVLETQEVDNDEAVTLLSLRNKTGWFLLKELPIESVDLEDVPETAVDNGDKTPSQRLRARMYVYYKNKNGSDTGFYEWYRGALDTIGDKYLDNMPKDE